MPGRWFSFALSLTHPGSSPATIVNSTGPPLPPNSVIRKIWVSHSADTTLQGNGRFDLVLIQGPNPALNAAPIGTSIFGSINAGGTNAAIDGGGTAIDLPYYSNPQGLAILEPNFLVEETGRRLCLTVRKSAVSIFDVAMLITVEQLGVPEGVDPPIIPRGTEAEPVCVKICGGEPVPQPPLPPGPVVEPPAPPSGPVEVDVIAEPLPPPSSIDVLFPMEAVGRICEAP